MGNRYEERIAAAAAELAQAIEEAAREAASPNLEVVSIAEAARRLNRSIEWVNKQIDAGLIRQVKVAPGDPVVSVASLIEFVNRAPARPPPRDRPGS